MNIEVTTAQAAEFFGVTARTVQLWGKGGCPQVARNTWDIKAVFEWWWENLGEDQAAAEAGGDDSLREAKRLYWWQKAKAEEAKNQRANGELVSWSDIDPEWASRVAAMVSGLSNLEHRLPAIAEGKTQKEMKAAIHKELEQIRAAYSRPGKYCPAQRK